MSDTEEVSQLSEDELDFIGRQDDSEDETELNQALATNMAVIQSSIENMKKARFPGA